MRKIILGVALVALALFAYQATAMGAGSTAAGQEQIRLVSTDRCDLVFQFNGFGPGTTGRLDVSVNGSMHSMTFQVPARSGVWDLGLHPLVGHPHAMIQVSYRIAALGMDHVVSGTVMVNCKCGGGGGGGAGGSSINVQSGFAAAIPGASVASSVSSQPGFAG